MFSWTVLTGGLKKPSSLFVELISKCINVYQNKIQNIILRKRILLKLTKLIEKKKHANQINKLGPCIEHFKFMLELLLRTLIYKKCKFMNGKIRDTSNKHNQKLYIIQNK